MLRKTIAGLAIVGTVAGLSFHLQNDSEASAQSGSVDWPEWLTCESMSPGNVGRYIYSMRSPVDVHYHKPASGNGTTIIFKPDGAYQAGANHSDCEGKSIQQIIARGDAGGDPFEK